VSRHDRVERLIGDLVEARDAFLGALDRLDHSAPLMGEWGARELVAHLGYWAGHAAEAIHAVEQDRAAEFEPEGIDVEQRNATVARVARATNLATVRRREAASVEALLERLRALDPAQLDVEMGDGDTLEAAIRDDGPDHYREHTEGLPLP
jgi:hypothetical protein